MTMKFRLTANTQAMLAAGAFLACTAFVWIRPLGPLDGDVAVGRVKRHGPPVDAYVTAEMSDGAKQTVRTTEDGTFWFRPMPTGTTTLTIAPLDASLQTQTFVVEMGQIQERVIVVQAVPKAPVTDVEGFDLEPSTDTRGRVGRPISVRTTVQGANTNHLEPTVWIDGGVGSLTPSGNLLPRSIGQGTLRAELLGNTKSVPITIDP